MPVALIHEFWSFGLRHGAIHWSDSGCFAGDCASIAVVLIAALFRAALLAALFACAGALLPRGAARRPLLGALWLLATLWMLVSIASGYRAGFGTTWLWHEPFLELLLHPVLTPGLLLAGLLAFLGWLRPRAA